MKKLLLSITAFAAFGAVKAQTNLDLETWSNGNPAGWVNTNLLFAPTTVTEDAGNGTGSSMKLTADSVYGILAQNMGQTDTAAYAFQIVANAPTYSSIQFDYKTANPSTVDTGTVFLGFIDNGVIRGISLNLQPIATWYSTPPVPLTGLYSQLAGLNHATDSLYIEINAETKKTRGNTAFLDNVILTVDNTSVYELFSNTKVNVYPNPANNIVNFELSNDENVTVTMYSIDGALVKTVSAFQKLTAIDINDLDNGSYIYKVATLNGNIIKSGQFIKQ